MSTTFLSHVPIWVWGLLAALIALGLSATRTQQKPLWAALAMPIVMTAMSSYGAASTFTSTMPALVAWASAVVIVLGLRAGLGGGGRVNWMPATRRVQVPGSGWPLVLILSIFMLKFAVAVTLAIRPELKANAAFATWICLMYGALSGIFLARVLAIRRAMKNASAAGTASLAS